MSFYGGRIADFYDRWRELTSDPEILQTVQGLRITINDVLPESNNFQYPFKKSEELFVASEIERLLEKNIIAISHYEPGQLISPIFTRPKSDGEGSRHFKMDSLTTVLTMIYPGVFMAKLDIKDAYYSIRIDEGDQNFFL